jgi:hypothetical protein
VALKTAQSDIMQPWMFLHVAFLGIFWWGSCKCSKSAVNCINRATVTLLSLLVGVTTTLRAERPNNMHSIPGKVTRFFSFSTGFRPSLSDTTSNSVHTRDPFHGKQSGWSVKLTIYLHIVPWLKCVVLYHRLFAGLDGVVVKETDSVVDLATGWTVWGSNPGRRRIFFLF